MALKEIAQKLWRRAKLLLLAVVRALYEKFPRTLDNVNYYINKFKRRRLDPAKAAPTSDPTRRRAAAAAASETRTTTRTGSRRLLWS